MSGIIHRFHTHRIHAASKDSSLLTDRRAGITRPLRLCKQYRHHILLLYYSIDSNKPTEFTTRLLLFRVIDSMTGIYLLRQAPLKKKLSTLLPLSTTKMTSRCQSGNNTDTTIHWHPSNVFIRSKSDN